MTRNRLTRLRVDEVSAVTKGANGKTFFILKAAATKTEGGNPYTASDYAFVPDASLPSGWKLRLAEYVDGTKQVTAAQVGRAVAALGPSGFRGNKVEIPEADMAGVRAKVRSAWKKANPDKDSKDMPESIRKTDESPPLFGWIRDTLRKLAGTAGPNTEVQDMTAEEIKKAVEDALGEGLAPIVKRLETLEAGVTPAETPTEPAVLAKTEAEATPAAAPEITAEDIAKLVGEAVSAAIEPLAKRLETVEATAGQRQSALEEGGAHQVKKADGSFSWEGSGLLV